MHTTALRETAKALRVRHSESMAHLAQLRTNTLPLMFYAEKEHLRETKEYLRESLNAFAILLQWGLEKVKTMDPVFVEKPNMRPLLKKHQQQKQKACSPLQDLFSLTCNLYLPAVPIKSDALRSWFGQKSEPALAQYPHLHLCCLHDRCRNLKAIFSQEIS